MEVHNDLLGYNRCPHFYTCHVCQRHCYDSCGRGNRSICTSCYEAYNKKVCTSCNLTYYLSKYYPMMRQINGKPQKIPYSVREKKCGHCASQE